VVILLVRVSERLVSSQFFYKAEEGRIVKTSKPDSAGTRNGAPTQPPSAS